MKAPGKGKGVRPQSTSGGKKAQPAQIADLLPIQNGPQPFPIVGIGASAGGLEALDEFLKHLPTVSPLALIVVQHLSPNVPGMLVELLQRTTQMKVLQATDRQAVEPGHIYVIPPGMDLSILRGRLFLFSLSEPRGQWLPIDFFFHALAQDRAALAIGMILSGMGSDGLLGSKAIKEMGGIILAQAPASARYDGMPGSVIKAGLADLVGTPAKLAVDLIHILAGKLNRLLPELSMPDP